MRFEAFVTWIVSEGGAGIVTYQLMEKVRKLANLQDDLKVYASWGIAAGVALFVWGLAIALHAVTLQLGPWYEWVKEAFYVATTAVLAGQFAHTYMVRRQKRLARNAS